MNRRRFFGLLPAIGAVAALPAASAVSELLPPRKVVAPILLERTCDGEWKNQKEYEAACANAGYRLLRGCGTVFQWYAGMTVVCPNCGHHYLCTLEDVKSGRFLPRG